MNGRGTVYLQLLGSKRGTKGDKNVEQIMEGSNNSKCTPPTIIRRAPTLLMTHIYYITRVLTVSRLRTWTTKDHIYHVITCRLSMSTLKNIHNMKICDQLKSGIQI